jgi:hypothetical protein
LEENERICRIIEKTDKERTDRFRAAKRAKTPPR